MLLLIMCHLSIYIYLHLEHFRAQCFRLWPTRATPCRRRNTPRHIAGRIRHTCSSKFRTPPRYCSPTRRICSRAGFSYLAEMSFEPSQNLPHLNYEIFVQIKKKSTQKIALSRV